LLIFKKIVSLFFTAEASASKQAIAVSAEAITDTGLVRDNNEDSYLFLPEHHLWAVADGMGGYDGGEIASAIAISSLKSAIASEQNLTDAIQASHRAIEQAARDGLGSKGMGSTIVAIQIESEHYQIGWVGDSRAYLYRENCEETLVEPTSGKQRSGYLNETGGEMSTAQLSDPRSLRCLTKDHSYVQLLLDQGLISESEAENHPQKNVITQALGGIGQSITVDCVKGKWYTGDIFLLCSDGLSAKVSAENMEGILGSRSISLADKADQLLKEALAAGGDDNITFILLMMKATDTGPINCVNPS